MEVPAKIKKLDEVVVNRIAAGEVIQRPANALKELIENSLDAKATNIQITTVDGGLKLLQIQDNGTGIRKEDLEIVCERFTTSKLQTFDDLKTIATFGFRGEALASMSHIAHLTITTKTASEKCAYKASYVDSKLKGPPKPCAGNQGTIITIENLFYNVPTRRKALSNLSDEFAKITDVVMKYAIHNPTVGFSLKKHKETTPHVRTPHNSSKIDNIRLIYGNAVTRELLEVESDDEKFKFKMNALITNANYTSKRMTFLLFINNRLVESLPMKRMLEDLYSIYLPKKMYPWCYISLNINPNNVDVNVHPTKHEVRFLHEDSIIERIKCALDEKLSGNNASRTFYLQSKLPKTDITKEVLKEVLPEYDKENADKSKKSIYQHQMIRTDASNQKLDKFNFTVHTGTNLPNNDVDTTVNQPEVGNNSPQNVEFDNETERPNTSLVDIVQKIRRDKKEAQNAQCKENIFTVDVEKKAMENAMKNTTSVAELVGHFSDIVDASGTPTSSKLSSVPDKYESNLSNQSNNRNDTGKTVCNENDAMEFISPEFYEDSTSDVDETCEDPIAEKARKRIQQVFRSQTITDNNREKSQMEIDTVEDQLNCDPVEQANRNLAEKSIEHAPPVDCNRIPAERTEEENENELKSCPGNNFRKEITLTSVLRLRKEVEDNNHNGLRKILSNLTFVGCIDKVSALVQSGPNLYICDTRKLAEELFYEIMLYDFANFGKIKFSHSISVYDLAMLALESEEAGWTEEDGTKEDLALSLKELFLEKRYMLEEYFSIVIDDRGHLTSLPILLEKYYPHEAGLPLYMLRLTTEVNWSIEQECFQNICRETARFYSEMKPMHQTHDWKYITEHVLYPAIKENLLPPKHFAHDSTMLQIASLSDLYKVFERC